MLAFSGIGVHRGGLTGAGWCHRFRSRAAGQAPKAGIGRVFSLKLVVVEPEIERVAKYPTKIIVKP